MPSILFRLRLLSLFLFFIFSYFGLSYASYIPFNTSNSGNIGWGTSSPQAKFVVVGGNVGIGTWTAAGGNLIVNGGGNVGIGSAWPGQVLDVNGIIRSTSGGFIFPDGSTQTVAASGGNSWSMSNGNVY